MNIKKIGLTALAGSLVAVAAHAGEMSVAGSASMGVKNNTGKDGGKSWTMGNQLDFSGGGELDNGINVALAFTLDHNDAAGSGPFDSHSLTLSSDDLGTLKIAGDGASNAQSALDTTAAGDIWDNGFTYTAPTASDAGTSTLLYTLPAMVDGVSISASYNGGVAAVESTTAYAATYTGVEGLSVSYGVGENGTTTASLKGDVTTLKGSYAVGSFTLAASMTDYDKDSGTDEEVTSYKLSYTVTDDLSISYGKEVHETTGQANDEEFDQVSVSYTTGGMTLSFAQTGADNLGGIATANEERWKLGASFAF